MTLKAKSYKVKRDSTATALVEYRVQPVLLSRLQLSHMPRRAFTAWICDRVSVRDHSVNVRVPHTGEPIEANVCFRVPDPARPRCYVWLPVGLGTWNAIEPLYQMTNFNEDCIMRHDPAPACLTLEEVAAFSVTYRSALYAIRIDMRTPSFVESIKTKTKAEHCDEVCVFKT